MTTAVTTTPAVARIEELVAAVPGWSPGDQLAALYNLVFASPLEGDVIEIGSWCGRSAVALGLAAQAAGGTAVHAVDLFPARGDWRRNADGTYSLVVQVRGREVRSCQDQRVWAEPFARDIEPVYRTCHSVREIFDRTIARAGLTDVVRPFQGTLELFAAEAPAGLRCRLAFVDGEHSYEAVCREIEVIERFLLPGGWICFDDAFSCYDGVDGAIADRILGSGRYDRAQQLTRKLFVARRRG